jgi:ATP-dependent Lon protease
MRAGIRRVLLPARNRRDIEDVPQPARDSLEFVFIDNVDDAADQAMEQTSNAGRAAVVGKRPRSAATDRRHGRSTAAP